MFTTVSQNIAANEIHMWTDSGRLVRPILIVYNNMKDKDYTHDKFKQWINITDYHIEKLRSGMIDINDLVHEGVVEYISPEQHESTNTLHLNLNLIDSSNTKMIPFTDRYTHADIPQGNMGRVALTSVFAYHNQAAHIVFQTYQIKQTNSWPLKNWAFAAHIDLYHQIYNEDPLVSTCAYRHIPPMDTNDVVAISIYGGFNQEDSLIVNRSSVDRGIFDAAHMTYHKVEVKQNEIVCKPDLSNIADIKNYCNCGKLVNGVVAECTRAQDGDCIVGRVAKSQKGEMKYPSIVYTDRSMVYRKKDPAYVWKVVNSPNYDDHELIKIAGS